MTGDVAAELHATVEQLEREEAATATRAERAANPALAAAHAAAAAPPAPEAQQADPREAIARLATLPPEKLTAALVLLLDLGVQRAAIWRGREDLAPKLALKPDERQVLTEVWAPAVQHYTQNATMHPLTLGLLGTGIVYGLKLMPEGGLEAVLGSTGQEPAPRAPSTAELLKPPPAPTTPQADPVLELARKQAEAIELERAKKAGNA